MTGKDRFGEDLIRPGPTETDQETAAKISGDGSKEELPRSAESENWLVN